MLIERKEGRKSRRQASYKDLAQEAIPSISNCEGTQVGGGKGVAARFRNGFQVTDKEVRREMGSKHVVKEGSKEGASTRASQKCLQKAWSSTIEARRSSRGEGASC